MKFNNYRELRRYLDSLCCFNKLMEMKKKKYIIVIEDTGGFDVEQFPSAAELKSMIVAGGYEGNGPWVPDDFISVGEVIKSETDGVYIQFDSSESAERAGKDYENYLEDFISSSKTDSEKMEESSQKFQEEFNHRFRILQEYVSKHPDDKEAIEKFKAMNTMRNSVYGNYSSPYF